MRFMVLLMAFGALIWAKGVIEVRGTSSVHDWKMVSKAVDVYMLEENSTIKTLQVSVGIQTFKSGNEALDNDAYTALGIDRVCPIVFTLDAQKEDGSLEGVIKIGCHEKSVVVMPERVENGVITGTFTLKMSSFGIEPPSLFAGMLTVDDTVEITYTISDDAVPIPRVLLRCVFPPKQRIAP